MGEQDPGIRQTQTTPETLNPQIEGTPKPLEIQLSDHAPVTPATEIACDSYGGRRTLKIWRYGEDGKGKVKRIAAGVSVVGGVALAALGYNAADPGVPEAKAQDPQGSEAQYDENGTRVDPAYVIKMCRENNRKIPTSVDFYHPRTVMRKGTTSLTLYVGDEGTRGPSDDISCDPYGNRTLRIWRYVKYANGKVKRVSKINTVIKDSNENVHKKIKIVPKDGHKAFSRFNCTIHEEAGFVLEESNNYGNQNAEKREEVEDTSVAVGTTPFIPCKK